MSEKTISDLVQAAIRGEYDIPEFQREFVWKPSQVAELADSLTRGYPVGCLVVWKSATVEGKEQIYVVDGQQRITALCIMYGDLPKWKDRKEWDVIRATYTPYLSVSSEGKFFFGRRRGESISLTIKDILVKTSEEEVNALISESLDASKTPVHSAARTILYEKAMAVWKSRLCCSLPIIEIVVQDPMEVAEIYQRLNTLGTRIRETDTQLAFIAVKNPGWVKSVFRGFIQELERKTSDRWSLPPGILLRCMTILDSATPRVGNVKDPEKFWKSGSIEAFEKLSKAIEDIIPRLERYGVQGIDEVPSDYTLIALFSFHAHFSKERSYDFEAIFRWFLAANIVGRYGDAPLERLTEDAGKIMKASNPTEALMALELPKGDIARALDEELLESFKRKSSGALILKVLLWGKAIDWRKGGKLSSYPPLEWHHIIPKKVLKNMSVDDAVANKISNMTLLSEIANKEFKDQPPWIYTPAAIPDPARLESHFISKSYSTAFKAGKAINDKDGLSKFLTERQKMIQKDAKELLNL